MPRYYFHLDGTRPYCDEDGTELPDDQAAWREAKRFARDIEGHLQPGEDWRLHVLKDSRLLYLLVVSSSRFE
jgi:Domain of unknown function (DUF6894)